MNERYAYVRKIGEGGSGTVSLVFDRKLHSYWAVKEVRQRQFYQQNMELKALKSISSEQFPRIADAFFKGDSLYLVMDYIEGESLKQRMKRGPLPEKEVIHIALQLAQGLHYLHSHSPQILYMDCKPGNILVNGEGKVKLVDLGSVYFCTETAKQRNIK